MTELKSELFAAPEDEWRHVPFVVNRHKWWLRWYRRDDGVFFFTFVSPKKRSYAFSAERGGVTSADVALANGETIASYWWGGCDTAKSRDAVIRLTPRHILDRLWMLLDATE